MCIRDRLDAGMVLAARADGAVEPAVVDRAVRATLRREGALLRVEQHLGRRRDALGVAAPEAPQVAALEVVDEATARAIESIAPAPGEDPHRGSIAFSTIGTAFQRAARPTRRSRPVSY